MKGDGKGKMNAVEKQCVVHVSSRWPAILRWSSKIAPASKISTFQGVQSHWKPHQIFLLSKSPCGLECPNNWQSGGSQCASVPPPAQYLPAGDRYCVDRDCTAHRVIEFALRWHPPVPIVLESVYQTKDGAGKKSAQPLASETSCRDHEE